MAVRDARNIAGAFGKRNAISIKRAYGLYIEDINGKRYLDLTAGGSTAVGYSHPRLNEALIEQIRKDSGHVDRGVGFSGLHSDLADEIKRYLPSSYASAKLVFGHSGSDAVEKAIRLVRFATKRSIIVSYFEAHHGANATALSASPTLREMGSNSISRLFQLPGFMYMPFPDRYRPWFGRDNTKDVGEASISFLDRLLTSVVSPDLVAGVIIEPILSYGGNVVPPPQYFEKLGELCRGRGIPLIVDEVLTAIGKTGKMFAMEHWDTWGDVICIGKALSGSLPLTVTLAKEDLAERWEPSEYVGISKDGHLLGCAASLEILRIVREERLVQNAEKMGAYFSKALRDLKRDRHVQGDIRGLGLMIGFDIVKSEKSREPDGELAQKVVRNSKKEGLIIGTVGAAHNVLRFMPALTISRTEIDIAIEHLDRAVSVSM